MRKIPMKKDDDSVLYRRYTYPSGKVRYIPVKKGEPDKDANIDVVA